MYNIYQQTFIYRSCCCEVALADGLGVGLWAPSISQAPGGWDSVCGALGVGLLAWPWPRIYLYMNM